MQTDPPIRLIPHSHPSAATLASSASSASSASTIERPDLEVIVPALNEEGRIGTTIDAIARQLEKMDVAHAKLRVIDNGSSDRTAEVVDDVGASHDTIDITVEGCARRGKGSAVVHGMLTSQASRIGFCDADLATPATAILDAVEQLDHGWPVVIGSRHLATSRRLIEQPLMRRLGGGGFRMMTKALAGDLDLVDTQCGFKFFGRDAAHEIFSRTELGGFAFDVEVLTRARELGYPIKEIPVEWTDKGGSTFRPVKHGSEVTRDLLRLRSARRRALLDIG